MLLVSIDSPELQRTVGNKLAGTEGHAGCSAHQKLCSGIRASDSVLDSTTAGLPMFGWRLGDKYLQARPLEHVVVLAWLGNADKIKTMCFCLIEVPRRCWWVPRVDYLY